MPALYCLYSGVDRACMGEHPEIGDTTEIESGSVAEPPQAGER